MKVFKGTKIYSIFTFSCPRCQKGKVFKYKNPYRFSFDEMGEIHKNCPNCGKDLEPEPSFYTGAMYVSYAISVAIVVGFFLAAKVLFSHINYNSLIALTMGVGVLLAPLNFRISRMIWANIFMKYEKDINAYKEKKLPESHAKKNS